MQRGAHVFDTTVDMDVVGVEGPQQEANLAI